MYILLTDETNIEEKDSIRFFVYGGVFFNMEKIKDLDKGMREIRSTAGYTNKDNFKFNTVERPSHVSLDNFYKAKNKVLDLCIRNEVKLILFIILHKITSGKSKEEIIFSGANHVIGRFNQFLEENRDIGICSIDRLPQNKEFNFIQDKFTKGLDFENGRYVTLNNIKLFTSTCNNASHLSSIMDIILGSFRYCINNPKNKKIAEYLLTKLVKILWYTKKEEKIQLAEKGIILRPKNIRVVEYLKEYHDLVTYLSEFIRK